jgi:hypothetical protein
VSDLGRNVAVVVRGLSSFASREKGEKLEKELVDTIV